MIPAGDERTPDGKEHAADGPTSEQLLSTTSTERDGGLILTVTGEVDGLTAARLRAAIRDAFDRLDGRVLVLDLAGVDFLGSAGLRTLLESAKEAERHPGNQPLRLVVNRNRPVIRPIEFAGLDKVLALYYDASEALAG